MEGFPGLDLDGKEEFLKSATGHIFEGGNVKRVSEYHIDPETKLIARKSIVRDLNNGFEGLESFTIFNVKDKTQLLVTIEDFQNEGFLLEEMEIPEKGCDYLNSKFGLGFDT